MTFALVGVASGQTARLNAVGLPVGGPTPATPSSCQVILTFLDDQGNSFTITQSVVAGKPTPLDLPFSEISSSANISRAEIRGTVQTNSAVTNSNGITAIGFCSVLPSFEIFD